MSGMADAATSLLKAYDLGGVGKTDDASVYGIYHALGALATLDLSAPEARPIVQLLEGMGSALRFVLGHPLAHFKALGLTAGAACAVRLP